MKDVIFEAPRRGSGEAGGGGGGFVVIVVATVCWTDPGDRWTQHIAAS